MNQKKVYDALAGLGIAEDEPDKGHIPGNGVACDGTQCQTDFLFGHGTGGVDDDAEGPAV